jgi:hypothetical protein
MRRVIYEDIDTAELVDRFFNDLATVLRILKVARYEHGLAAFLLNEPLHLIRLVGLIEKGDQDIGAFSRVRD